MDKEERIEEITRTTNQKLLSRIAQTDGDWYVLKRMMTGPFAMLQESSSGEEG